MSMSALHDSDSEINAHPFQDSDSDEIEEAEEDGNLSDTSENKELQQALEISRKDWISRASERNDLHDAIDISQNEPPGDTQEYKDLRAALAHSRGTVQACAVDLHDKGQEEVDSDDDFGDKAIPVETCSDWGSDDETRSCPGVEPEQPRRTKSLDEETRSYPSVEPEQPRRTETEGYDDREAYDISRAIQRSLEEKSNDCTHSRRKEARDLQMALELSMSQRRRPHCQDTREDQEASRHPKVPKRA